jgi:predicted anti-sigma-YlaC factor YlaD
MNCKATRELFSLRLDGALSFQEVRSFQDHLAQCTACSEEFVGFERTVGLVRSLPEVAPPAEFVQNVLRAARQAKAPSAPMAPAWRERLSGIFETLVAAASPRAAVAALALGLIVGVGGSMVLFQSRAPRIETAATAADPSPVQTLPVSSLARSSSPATATTTTSPPSGQFEDLVQEMLRRAGTTEEVVEDSLPELEWGVSPDAGGMGRQVNAGSGSGSGRDGRVTRVF